MNRSDINAAFTAKVAGLLGKGYVINPATMAGSQGEIAKVDLCKGDELLRVWLETGRDWGRDFMGPGYISIRIGRCTDPRCLNSGFGMGNHTVWNHELEVLEETRFSIIEFDVFCTEEEAKEVIRKRRARLEDRYNFGTTKDFTGNEKARAIALRYLRRQPRMKSCKSSDIESITVCKNCFTIRAKGKAFTLCANKHTTAGR